MRAVNSLSAYREWLFVSRFSSSPVPLKLDRPDAFYLILKKKKCGKKIQGKKSGSIYKKLKHFNGGLKHADYRLTSVMFFITRIQMYSSFNSWNKFGSLSIRQMWCFVETTFLVSGLETDKRNCSMKIKASTFWTST